ncbi:hypothetical protein D3C78_1036870 [compost metagenome]
MLLHLLVFGGATRRHFQAGGHLPIGVNLLDDATHQAGPGNGGEGATDQRAGALGGLRRTVKRRIDLRQVAVDVLRGASNQAIGISHLAAQLSGGGLDLDQQALDFLVRHHFLRAIKNPALGGVLGALASGQQR